ncbi:DUF4097 family beta strand repeat-containing protein [Listeria sp. PSOL-1]|uniref:DUF4097 family beta strand repeat-containing protein n=1 Tax=Listeria sp. PSOL-1 TaxID=1844999 RepID=UPI0013D05806|nr:DUF4097 family beta strand repeat-containing protein [Listeria sp. PSOL-1]
MGKKLKRSRVDRKIGGVFGGLSEYTGIDATLLRLIFVVVAIVTVKTGIAFIAYIIALFIIPPDDLSNEEVLEQHRRKAEEKARYASNRRRARFEQIDRMKKRHRTHVHTHVHKGKHEREPLVQEPKQWPVREFTFENTTCKEIALRIATGDVTIDTWENETLKMRVELAVHERARTVRQFSEDQLWDCFFSQTMLDINQECFTFESKKEILKTNVTLTLPNRLYEQIKIQLLNGSLKYNDLAVEDGMVKVHHGDIRSSRASGKFLSTEALDGEIYCNESNIENVDMKTARGDILLSGKFLTIVMNAEQGDIDLALENDTATSVDLKAPKGDIRIQIPSSWNVDGTMGTKREKIYFDLKNAKVWDSSAQSFVFTQNADEMSTATLQAQVNTGIIKVTELTEKPISPEEDN